MFQLLLLQQAARKVLRAQRWDNTEQRQLCLFGNITVAGDASLDCVGFSFCLDVIRTCEENSSMALSLDACQPRNRRISVIHMDAVL